MQIVLRISQSPYGVLPRGRSRGNPEYLTAENAEDAEITLMGI
jgi:hypothetical protein